VRGFFDMTRFAIQPPILVRGPRGTFVRSTDEAAAYVRRRVVAGTGNGACALLARLDLVGTLEQARPAGSAFRRWVGRQQ
jgi:hypothetical protein